MSATLPGLDRAAGLAPAARLLAGWWSRPTADERARWAAEWEGAGDVANLLELPRSGLDELHEAAADARQDALLEEYERLLVGPGRAPCPPYESLWRTDAPRREQGRLMGASSADVTRLYGELGLRVRFDAHELPDHLVVEWEALAYALDHGAPDAAAALAREHLALWLPGFCAAVGAATEDPFYAALARLTPEWLAAFTA